MNNPLVLGLRRSELSGHVEHRLRDELGVLRGQRDQLRGDSAEDYRAGDAGDRAEAMRRADDVFRIEDRISEINHLLATGRGVRMAPYGGGILAEGSIVTLRFPDGEVETFYASSVLDPAPEYAQIELLGLDSPLAKALAGHTAGDTICWGTPAGSRQAELLRFQPPTVNQ